jgi:hypothetical protein
MQNALALFRVKMDMLYLMVRTRENVFLIYVKGGDHGKYLIFIHISGSIVFVCVSNLLACFHSNTSCVYAMDGENYLMTIYKMKK